MSELQKGKPQKREKNTAKVPTEASHGVKGKETTGKTKEVVDIESPTGEVAHHEDTRPVGKMENTYQMGPYKRFPVGVVTRILKDVLTTNLQEEKYEAEWSQKMTIKICEVTRARVKALKIPRYKVVILVHIGQLTGQSMQISSRCLWDKANDTFATYSVKNSSLFGMATVYGVYYE
ncbi:dynein light chain Tctex-type 5-B-like [Limanda limanda]|uniref:dynein light chain Tctex-type 5-B-like n=1 Tax=Limanda limanda TaxID=27771 RepID=UPI0029C8668B|nr:dynein light chain Tctex-type 5-B-like [Limanda limanda]